MSDGPHRTLPLRKHWKDLAKRCEEDTFSDKEREEALMVALIKEFKGPLLPKLAEIFGDTDQRQLFLGDCSGQLNALRQDCLGSVEGNRLIDCAEEAYANGMQGAEAVQYAVKNALQAHLSNISRQIEEHHYRVEPETVAKAMEKLHRATGQCDCDSITSDLLQGKTRGKISIQKRKGIDEGPPS